MRVRDVAGRLCISRTGGLDMNGGERPIDQEVCPADCPPECPPDKRRREMWIGHRHGHCDLARSWTRLPASQRRLRFVLLP